MYYKIVDKIEEIYKSRNILKALVVKNLFGRYRSSAIGFGWHFVMPIMMMFIYYIVFTQLRIAPIDNFWIYLGTGLFPYYFMYENLIGGSSCITNNGNMVKKMYFPRELLIISQIISTFITLIIGLIILLAGVAMSGHHITISWIMSIVALIMMIMFVTGYVFLFSTLTVYCKDIHHVLNSLSLVFFFLTPIYFVIDSISGIFQILVWANPFTYYVEMFHQILYYNTFPSITQTIIILAISTASLILGMTVFYKMKKGFAERL